MSSEADLGSKALSFICHTCLDINMLFSLCMSLSFSLSVAMKIILEGVLSVCMCVWVNWGHCYSSTSSENLEEEAEIPAQSNVGGCFKSMCVRVDYPVLMCACSTYVCKHLFLHTFIQCLCGLHKELLVRRALAAELFQPIAVAGLLGAPSVHACL